MIEARDLTKRFGDKLAVDHLSFSVQPGRVTGFLGPNGAGKSTTMRLILGLDRANGGTATINGVPYAQLPQPLLTVGALLEAKSVHTGRSARNHLLFLAQTQGLPASRVDSVLELVGLRDVAGKRAGGFSLGMSQRLGVAAAMLGNPKVLLLDASALQPSRSARHHLLWLAQSQGLGLHRVDEVIGLTGLATATRRKAGGYSLGMRQRLGIAAALLGDPPVLMLDEPFNGLDPEGILWMRGFLRTLAAEGRSVLVSSHLMSELQDAADHLVVAGRGRVVADTSVADLIAATSAERVTLRTSAPHEAMTALSRAGAEVADEGGGRLTVSGLSSERTVVLLNDHRVPFSEVTAHRASLEAAYLDLTRDAVEFRPAAAEAAR